MTTSTVFRTIASVILVGSIIAIEIDSYRLRKQHRKLMAAAIKSTCKDVA